MKFTTQQSNNFKKIAPQIAEKAVKKFKLDRACHSDINTLSKVLLDFLEDAIWSHSLINLIESKSVSSFYDVIENITGTYPDLGEELIFFIGKEFFGASSTEFFVTQKAHKISVKIVADICPLNEKNHDRRNLITSLKDIINFSVGFNVSDGTLLQYSEKLIAEYMQKGALKQDISGEIIQEKIQSNLKSN